MAEQGLIRVGRLVPSEWLGQRVRVVIDRPLGSTHPDGGFQYRLNYGMVPEYIAPDGEALDAYVIGPDEPVEVYEGEVVGVVLRSDDVEDKLIVSAVSGWTSRQLEEAVAFQEQFFASRVITYP